MGGIQEVEHRVEIAVIDATQGVHHAPHFVDAFAVFPRQRLALLGQTSIGGAAVDQLALDVGTDLAATSCLTFTI